VVPHLLDESSSPLDDRRRTHQELLPFFSTTMTGMEVGRDARTTRAAGSTAGVVPAGE
jgi:hypothetical protein